ncbi:energy transducer TonB [Burkholderia sp. SIMBA_043]|uniref:energy transducer TonB n=1 Tax=Burkholderia TaxID=32008 RepID=UPI000D12AB1D|nr:MULTISPECIES: energy transducer TonB [Burkholderia cepacia complex]AVR15010.1 hypothetical protein A8H33_15890 [Burkholderia vietnamiensis]MBR8033562.1 energy transducer TonB [Burkholderia vietnamiensis]UBI29120.1 energy transducer TonB [Burkholderia vietnamiensis]
MDRLLRQAGAQDCGRRRVIARVLLDERGHVQDVVLKHSCGDSELDARALDALREQRYGVTRTGKRAVRRWQEVAYPVD